MLIIYILWNYGYFIYIKMLNLGYKSVCYI